jgi:hypothetical protein
MYTNDYKNLHINNYLELKYSFVEEEVGLGF